MYASCHVRAFERINSANVEAKCLRLVRIGKDARQSVTRAVSSNISHPVAQNRQKYIVRYFCAVFSRAESIALT